MRKLFTILLAAGLLVGCATKREQVREYHWKVIYPAGRAPGETRYEERVDYVHEAHQR